LLVERLDSTLQEKAMSILQAPVSKGRTDQNVHHIARICCTPTASKLKREASTSTHWQTADPAVLQTLRAVVEAGNEKFGHGSHWIERRYTAEDPSAR
jgi:hypothetical protein